VSAWRRERPRCQCVALIVGESIRAVTLKRAWVYIPRLLAYAVQPTSTFICDRRSQYVAYVRKPR